MLLIDNNIELLNSLFVKLMLLETYNLIANEFHCKIELYCEENHSEIMNTSIKT